MDSMRQKTRLTYWLLILTGLCLFIALILIRLLPEEKTMGAVQKIFYFHVPAAYAMYLGFGLGGVFSLLFLLGGKTKVDALAFASIEVGVIFCTLVLLTGPLWGRKAWGAYWTWDFRLTSTLIVWVLFVTYLLIRYWGEAHINRKLSAFLALFGVVDIPIIHYSVRLWSGHHPQVIFKGGLTSEMVLVLVISLLGFTLLYFSLFYLRYRIQLITDEIEASKI